MAGEDNGRAPAWRSALMLGAIALAGTALLAGVDSLTRERIAEQERRAVLQLLNQLVAPGRYDNELHADAFTFSDAVAFPGAAEVTVYRARLRGEAVALVMKLAAPDGYNGRINLLVGIDSDGTLSGVRVTSHKETPGLGDGIEVDKSDWILAFDGQSLEQPGETGWAVKRDGGVFDQFTGATITPRAIVRTVHRALRYFAAHRDELFAHPSAPAQGNS